METMDVICFGEFMMRLDDASQSIETSNPEEVKFAGSEANVAVSLATLGDRVGYVTRLPIGIVGNAAVHRLAQYGIDTSRVLRSEGKIGSYFLQQGASRQKAKTVYDRDNTPFSSLRPGIIPWHDILKGAKVFHTSGISAAISQSSADATFEALDVADEMGLTVSFDINYRSALWNYGADPKETLVRMMQRCDVMFGDVIEFEYITGKRIPFEATSADYKMDLKAYEEWCGELHALCPRCKRMIIGIRSQPEPRHHVLTAIMIADGKMIPSVIHDITDIVDPVGVGDAFAAGSIHAALNFPDDPQRWVDYALAAATLKNQVPGDFNLASDEQISKLAFLK
jgi:2-dehydro-3-deoxygluconokinase